MENIEFGKESRSEIPISHKGSVAEITVAKLFFKNNFDVFRSMAPSSHFDLVAYDRDCNRMFKIEVKSSYKKGKTTIPIPVHTEYHHNIWAIYIKKDDEVYLAKKNRSSIDYRNYISPMRSLGVDFNNHTLTN